MVDGRIWDTRENQEWGKQESDSDRVSSASVLGENCSSVILSM